MSWGPPLTQRAGSSNFPAKQAIVGVACRLGHLREMTMNSRMLPWVLPSVLLSAAVSAQTTRITCENWHPRLGKVGDMTVAIDAPDQTCNGQRCKITESELAWSEQGGRYEISINRTTGEGYIYFAASSERTALLKNCRPSDR